MCAAKGRSKTNWMAMDGFGFQIFISIPGTSEQKSAARHHHIRV
jgi:extradiol dioxygenase family protein